MYTVIPISIFKTCKEWKDIHQNVGSHFLYEFFHYFSVCLIFNKELAVLSYNIIRENIYITLLFILGNQRIQTCYKDIFIKV